jgi:hypothetical protein
LAGRSLQQPLEPGSLAVQQGSRPGLVHRTLLRSGGSGLLW